MNRNKISPCIWLTAYEGHLLPVIEYYQTVFEAAFQAGSIVPLGETPSGYAEMSEVLIFGQTFTVMNTENPHHPLNDAVSLMIHCDGQEEIDHYWNYFTLDGKEAPCGWRSDKYGLRWQLLPKNLAELMSMPHSMKVLMQQRNNFV